MKETTPKTTLQGKILGVLCSPALSPVVPAWVSTWHRDGSLPLLDVVPCLLLMTEKGENQLRPEGNC